MIENPMSFLPHGKEILAIKEILKLEEKSIRCEVLAKGSAFNHIEYFAQAAAVGRIANAKNAYAKIGMILRIKEFMKFSNKACSYVECFWSDSIGGAYEIQGNSFCKDHSLIAKSSLTLMEQA